MAAAASTLGHALASKRPSALAFYWRRFRRRKAAMVALVLIVAEILLAVLAPWIAPYGPYDPDYPNAYQLPTAKHWLGTDDLGRDELSRLIYGARVSIAVGLLTQLAAVLIGLPIGALAGLLGGGFDYLVMRIIDVLSALPNMLFYILLMVVLGPGFVNIIIALSVTGWIGIARLVRGQVLSLKQTDYVRASLAMGADTRHIVGVHLVRNALTPVIVSVALGVPGAMLAEAGLSFLGIGIRMPQPSWGQMISMYQAYLIPYWHLTVFPAIVLALTMLAWGVVGDGLREALDPSIRA